MQIFVSCPPGVADLTAAELRNCGASQTREFKLGVQAEGTLEVAYRACLWSRTASRVLLPLGVFPAATQEQLYEGISSIDWQEHLNPNGTLAIDFGGASSGITHTHFGALKTKDAIVDQFRERTGERPSVQLDQPDVRIDVRLDRDRATVSLDLSGDSLHRRAYRARGVAAPLKENLAAAVLLRCGWPAIAEAGGELIDPMCGSGTLPIEAAMMALDIAPGLLRSYFGFIGWRGHDRALWDGLIEEARARREATASKRITLRGYDTDAQAVRAAIENVERAKLRGFVHIERRDLEQLARESGATSGLVVANPPYGERIGDQEQLQALYQTFGAKLREQFEGWKAAVLTGNPPLAKAIGINARRTHTLFNGRIECRLLRFDVAPGDYIGERKPPPDAAALRERPGAKMFANRLAKNIKNMQTWARRDDVDCYRVYDADMPEYAFAIDQYSNGDGERWVVVQEYAPPRTIDPKAARQRRDEALAVIPHELGLADERIFIRERRQQKDGAQYEKLDNEREYHIVREQPYRFAVNFTDYLDTGLFLDHRLTRRMVGEMARDKRFLNLFAYTGTATVHAAGGGAASSTTVDMSRTYLDWAKRNLALNNLAGPQHGFVQEDCLAWLRDQRDNARRWDLMFIDPPTHSRSKRMDQDFDVQRDHVELLTLAAQLLAPGGSIVFSNNFTRFRLDRDGLAAFDIEDIGRRTLPRDFERSPRIHACYVLRLRAQGSERAGVTENSAGKAAR
ncbi:bifunctional 23S rRNA (guanine(2069)-N(7))-methyltransferase RlmK/23S rRNA (guanine(2445)-N(2))-methyltransferase RlmL [Steroidobacter sp.]|uniref:bifunctional 23S rRNA (guanine(2069)-N(7))-methyltransferase RlmK/23S rRNA (guanine(2445)-N(2))-methyltransferase RlmL n=1 Tax=Steroidobacter sp. TaxID=1978227 RepID=UPI001A5E82F5|nr:bifunctional 23S rRNA (guanine(2069)-N(7))-methyltransferase RlmK/23S rRNA (guanine(2445)-N(2))-methyltransferase RlmL [Steroidobacter sp.]MBL8266401.1 bifunctional 23S rRNA (guanine(2069)-N(7))-methyltransferase RlmK/23S rRNA (guanine(2445)-N(2))-methyltransferase RlmL [Steroidobacter sp.]